MATVSENLTTLIGIKNDIKTAIINKGVEVGDDFNSYATAIGSINGGGGSGLDYSGLGYSDSDISGANSVLQDSINIAKRIYNEWVPSSEHISLSSISEYINNDLLIFPLIDTRYVIRMSQGFSGCDNLRFIPLLNTSSVTNMYYMFSNCASLITIPQLNTSSVTSMGGMFYGCSSLTTIPQLNTSSVTDMSEMFDGCSSLTTIPLLDTSSVTSMYEMFNGCSSLQSIPQLDTSSVTSMTGMFYECYNLTDMGGFLDVKTNMNFRGLKNITKQSWINIFTNLYDWNTNPDNLDPYDFNPIREDFNGQPTIRLSNGVSQIESDSETIAIATNKGWYIVFTL